MQSVEVEKLLALAQIHRESGDIDKATSVIESLLKQFPGHPEALFWLSQQTRIQIGSTAFKQLEDWYEKGGARSPDQRSYLWFALARVREDQGRWDEAYELYLNANKERKISLNLFNTDARIYIGQAKLHRALYKKLKRLPTFVFGSDHGRDLVFIVGLPRCGSTLVETILCGYPEVKPLGEINAFREALQETEIISLLEDDATSLNQISKRLDSIDTAYRRKLPCDLGIKVDKTLTNFYFLGLISRIWPAARIIHVQRHPLDQIVSAWRSRFLKGHSYSLELRDLVKVFISYRQLIDFWKIELGPRIYHCKYEQLVTNPKSETSSLAAFCGIPWSEKMLRPQDANRIIKTASFGQVRQPINDRSIGQWKNFSNHLSQYKSELIEAGIDIND